MKTFIYENKYMIMISLISSVCLLILFREIIKAKVKKMKRYNGVELASATFIGDRELQEDAMNIVLEEKGILAVLADGRGKNHVGKISSQLAVKIFAELFANENAISNANYFFKRAFNITNREILKKLYDHQGGASIVCAVIIEDLLHYALVGNTMIAVFRNNELIPLSEGHTVNVLAQRGFYQGKISKQQALWALKEKRLLNYVGQDGFKDVEIYDVPIRLKKGDLIMLMSDGIHQHASWNKLEEAMKKHLTCDQIAENIIHQLKDDAIVNKDNASIIIMRYRGHRLRV
ncbi:PP2C family protein-serine/threonine phosphatase [Marinisporobacter balticus]|uniref:Serine/threonine protein phosphatase PrpC n=1 Tax=Marinisporobacter balticus TaxID=2018667 RepID=A0A4R2KXV4_9FIRM|nr:PP2C family serine/threonine-protein phosphatase [Marinisporobacter balticus]TCO71505.1 serine/threonine protein phosphatase PrpC [Marinisporobacter balticus]